MQVAGGVFNWREAQAKAVGAGGRSSFSADIERQRMSAEGLMGPFAITPTRGGNDRAVVYQRYIRPDGGLGSGFMEKPRWGTPRGSGRQSARSGNRSRPDNCWQRRGATLWRRWQTRAALKNINCKSGMSGKILVTVTGAVSSTAYFFC